MTLINGITDLLMDNGSQKDQANYAKNMQVLKQNIHELNSLIQEILEFRKAEESGFSVTYIQRCSISHLAHQAYESFAILARHDAIDFQVEVPDQLYWNTEVSYFKKILNNLISNAFKYTSIQGVIRVSLYVEDNTLMLKVYNTGVGIQPDELNRIFDRYHVLEKMQENKYLQMTSRTGLGLYICHHLVNLLQGQIDVRSEVDHFVEITVRFPSLATDSDVEPALNSQKDPAAFSVSPRVPSSLSPSPNKPVILVVDDNQDILWYISTALEKEYTVVTAANASEALEQLNTKTPALIVTDIIMPGMDGLTLIEQIKANKFAKHIPLIIISAKITDREQAEGLDKGADAYLTKPFSPLVLRSLIERLLTKKQEWKNYYYSPESAYEITEGKPVHLEDKEFIAQVNKIIQESIENETLSPEFLASCMHMDTRTFYRRTKKIVGVSPSELIKDYRLTTAARLLITTNLSVQEIVYKVGISNKSYFYREFLKKYQLTPQKYRENK